MKKLFITLAIVFAGIMSANAQVWIGGGLGARIEKNYKEFNVAPEIGYAINNHWQVALGVDYTFANSDVLGKANTLSLEPYVRYVAATIGNKFSLFFDLTGDFGLIDASGWAATLRPGIAWMATEHWTAAFRFGFAGYDHGFYGGNGFYLNCELASPRIGLYYNF